jgi:hypothetical protein
VRDLAESVGELEKFTDGRLKFKLRDIEDRLVKGDVSACVDLNATFGIGPDLLEAAATIKRAAAQIDVLVHSIGILHLLPSILEKGENVEYLSLGAGNTGKKFDLETDRQIAEFTFIAWRGGSEAIRQNKLFVDFIHLAEAKTQKTRNLFVLGMQHPEKFFKSRRAISSVLHKRPDEARALSAAYGNMFSVVNEYYRHHAGRVDVRDISQFVPRSLLAEVESLDS